jgi:hypothetical protein
VPAEREKAICLALADADERVIRVGINAAREHGLPKSAVGIVQQRMDDDALSEETCAAVIRLLAGVNTPEVIGRLTNMVLQRALLGRQRLAEKSPEMLAALTVLAASDGTDARARTALELARASNDADIRNAVTRK